MTTKERGTSIMKKQGIALALAMTLALAGGFAGAATVDLPGGGKASSDCYGGLKVSNDNICSSTANKIEALAVNGACEFKVAGCVNLDSTSCTPKNVTKFKAKGVPAPTLGSASSCGAEGTIIVKVKGKKKKRPKTKTVRLQVKTSDGKPKGETDRIKLVCKPTCPGACDNKAGGPDEVEMVVGEEGTDLDNGWTGDSMNFPTPANSTVFMCLDGCDDSTNPACTGSGATGSGTKNGQFFGPPLPLLAANVPVCVLNVYRDAAIPGSYNLDTGEASMQVNLNSEVYFTDPAKVCPRCTGTNVVGGSGTCDSGQREGQACTVQSILRVALSTASNKDFQLTSDCLPIRGNPDGVLDIRLGLTTETTPALGTGGPIPCGQEPSNPKALFAQDNGCQGSTCGSPCSFGSPACLTKNSNGDCVDAKGGLSQLCCNNNAAKPCHPVGITRTGARAMLTPAWPDPTYPKVGTGTLAAVFCEQATNTFTINATTGLPGPGTVLLPGVQTIRKFE
jgi:hypothetical protein